jgi:hypothetical protein
MNLTSTYHSNRQLGLGHTFPVGEAWVEGSQCDHMLVSLPNVPEPEPELNWLSIIAAGCFGLFTWFALGGDFPDSNKRFARLA